jgi:hypothetical protein
MSQSEKWEIISHQIIEAANDSKDFTEWERQDYESLLQELLRVVND